MTENPETIAVDGAHPPVVRTPPTVPGAVPLPLSRWPAVLGVISIVLGGFGVLRNSCGVFGAFSTGLITTFFSSQPGASGPEMQQQVALMQAGMPSPMLSVLEACLALLTSVLLLIAGIQCVRRESMARVLHLVWAGARVLVAVLTCVVGYLTMQSQAKVIQGMGGAGGGAAGMPPGFAGYMSIMGRVGIVLTFAWGVAYPVVVVVWFSKLKVRAEVAGWAKGVR
ncbi:MAG: hypothetical protein ACK51T_01635 [bacterium]